MRENGGKIYATCPIHLSVKSFDANAPGHGFHETNKLNCAFPREVKRSKFLIPLH
jgi:hypothetical protein